MKFHKPDYIYIVSIGILLAFGLLMLFSASSPEAYGKFSDSYFFIKRQILFGVIPGAILFFVCSQLDYHLWFRWAKPLFYFSILLLVLVLIPGVGGDIGTARSWFKIAGISFQPSELVKLTMIFYLAGWLETVKQLDPKEWRHYFLPFIFVLLIVGGLLMKQPDLGTFIIIFIIAVAVFLAGGGHWFYLFGVGGAAFLGFVVLIFTSSYRLNRLMTFLNSKNDVLGVGYHINQALLAVGSGGLWGLGWGHSRQKFQYLPEVSADSIFAIIAEELGFVISTLFVLFLGFIFWRGLNIAKKAPDKFGRLLAVGVSTWLIGQSFVNIGAMIGVSPLTGVPLPLVSHGGTAMTVLLAGLGIVVNVSRQTRQI